MTNFLPIALIVTEDCLIPEGISLAKKFNIPFFEQKPHEEMPCLAKAYLIKYPNYLAISFRLGKKIDYFYVDFLSSKMRYRVQNASYKNEMLIKAMGLKKRRALRVLDATAGFGEDGFLLASRGCAVTMLERSPVVFALLEDGITRALATLPLAIKAYLREAIDYLQNEATYQSPDVVYLDPMFPERKKKALVKKKMQIISSLVNLPNEREEDKLLACALSVAKERVVVKRPDWAPCLSDIKPSLIIASKNYRFDVYLTNKLTS